MPAERGDVIARKKPLASKRAKARTWRCPHCLGRTTARTCPCGIRKGTKRTSLKARCDALARALCRKLADGKCARCGGPGSDWAHRFPRRHHSVRWSMDNCDFLCRACHRHFTDHPASFMVWLVERMGGVDEVCDLERRANAPWDRDYAAVLSSLTEKRKEEA